MGHLGSLARAVFALLLASDNAGHLNFVAHVSLQIDAGGRAQRVLGLRLSQRGGVCFTPRGRLLRYVLQDIRVALSPRLTTARKPCLLALTVVCGRRNWRGER